MADTDSAQRLYDRMVHQGEWSTADVAEMLSAIKCLLESATHDWAVIEQRDLNGEWQTVAYIGPDRSADGYLEIAISEDRPLRIRYLTPLVSGSSSSTTV